jgi:type I restriction enzyme S subunit
MDIAEVRAGWGFPNTYQGRSSGAFPFFKVSDMNTSGNETEMTVANNYIDERAVKSLGIKPAPAGTVIFPKIGAAIATNKKRILNQASAYDNNVFGIVPSSALNPRYLLHYFRTIDLKSLAFHSGALPSIRKSELNKFQIPVPSLEGQERIVSVLDKFDALVSDLSIGLPAELSARRSQYEYYRGKLLTFPEYAKTH